MKNFYYTGKYIETITQDTVTFHGVVQSTGGFPLTNIINYTIKSNNLSNKDDVWITFFGEITEDEYNRYIKF